MNPFDAFTYFVWIGAVLILIVCAAWFVSDRRRRPAPLSTEQE